MFHTNLHVLDKIFGKMATLRGYFIIAQVTNLSGVSFAIIRIVEPYVWDNFKEFLKDIFYLNVGAKGKRKFTKESLDSFLKSAMNIEYVYLILLGINQTNERE